MDNSENLLMDKVLMTPEEFLNSACPELTFNDQGTANFFKLHYPGFEDNIYPILELYSLGGIRPKEFKNHIKKLKKKDKFRNDTKTPEEVLKFEKLSLEDNIIISS